MSFSSDKQRQWFFANHPEYGDHEGRFGDDFRERLAQRKSLAESLDNLNKLLGTSVTIPGISLPLPAEGECRSTSDASPWKGSDSGHTEPTSSGTFLDKAGAGILDKLRQNPQFAMAERILKGQQWNDEYHAAARNVARMAAEAIVPQSDMIKNRQSLVEMARKGIEEALQDSAPDRLPEIITKKLWEVITDIKEVTSIPAQPKPDLYTYPGSLSAVNETWEREDALRADQEPQLQRGLLPRPEPAKPPFPEIPWWLQKVIGKKPYLGIDVPMDWENIPRDVWNRLRRRKR